MTTKQLYTCDFCKKESDRPHQKIGLWLNPERDYSLPYGFLSPMWELDICPACVTRLHISWAAVEPKEKEGQEREKSASERLEELIQEIAENGIEWREANR